MKLLNLTRPLNNEEISQMHAINQANSPDVGDIPNVNQFKETQSFQKYLDQFQQES